MIGSPKRLLRKSASISVFTPLKAFGEVAVAFHHLIVTEADSECAFGADYHDMLLRTGDAGVKQIPL